MPFHYGPVRLTHFDKIVGRTPWSARVPLDPLFDQPNQSDATPERTTGGAAADQGGPPYVLCGMLTGVQSKQVTLG
jgi:hypothetical protein